MDLDAALDLLAREPEAPLDLVELALHLARDEYPDLDVDAFVQQVDGMAHEVRPYLRGDLKAKVTGLCRYLFHDLGFRGNVQRYDDPHNSYLNEVLERRTGIPISLSAVTIGVGVRAGLDIQGVGLPGHFIVKALANLASRSRQRPELDDKTTEEILFDPFHGGRVLTPADCEILVYQVTGSAFVASAESLVATPLAVIVSRMLNNLRGIYLTGGDWPRAVRVMERMLQINPDEARLHRDMGIGLVELGRPGKAIEHLQSYLQSEPGPEEGEITQKWLRRAQRELSRWN
jgi:regulator of sirC expression with transglutaminase-like and TPR domain